MPLKLERCTIRDWRADDAASLAKNANNRKIWLGLRDLFPHPYTINDANEFLQRSEEHTSELQSLRHLVCRLLLEKKKTITVQVQSVLIRSCRVTTSDK